MQMRETIAQLANVKLYRQSMNESVKYLQPHIFTSDKIRPWLWGINSFTHWRLVVHICGSELDHLCFKWRCVCIWHQVFSWTIAGLSSVGALRTSSNVHWKNSSNKMFLKYRQNVSHFCSGFTVLNVLRCLLYHHQSFNQPNCISIIDVESDTKYSFL